MKRIVVLFVTLTVTMIIIPTSRVCAVGFSPGIKVGLNYYRQYHITDWCGRYPETKYRPSLYVGVYYEIKWTNRFSTIAELAFVHKEAKGSVYVCTDEYWDLESKYNYLHFPFLFKIQTKEFFKPYFLIGIDFEHLLRAEYRIFEQAQESVFKDEKITHLLPSVDVAVDFGIGKKIKILNMCIILEVRYSKGLTNLKYEYAGSWRNHGIQVLVGIQWK